MSAVSDSERRRNIQKVVLCTAISIFIENRRRRLFKRKQIKRFWNFQFQFLTPLLSTHFESCYCFCVPANFCRILPDNSELLQWSLHLKSWRSDMWKKSADLQLNNAMTSQSTRDLGLESDVIHEFLSLPSPHPGTNGTNGTKVQASLIFCTMVQTVQIVSQTVQMVQIVFYHLYHGVLTTNFIATFIPFVPFVPQFCTICTVYTNSEYQP